MSATVIEKGANGTETAVRPRTAGLPVKASSPAALAFGSAALAAGFGLMVALRLRAARRARPAVEWSFAFMSGNRVVFRPTLRPTAIFAPRLAGGRHGRARRRGR